MDDESPEIGLGGLLFFGAWALIGTQRCQIEARATQDVSQRTAWLSCWDDRFQNYKSRSLQSPQLVAPDGLHRAYVVVEAQAKGKDSHGGDICQNRSILYVSNSGGREFDSVLTEVAAGTGSGGNGIQLIDWSADSAHLLADLITWRYYSEGWEHLLMLYSVREHSVVRLDLNLILSHALGKICLVDGQAKGFLEDSQLAFEAWGVPDEEGDSCVQKRELWAIDWKKSAARKASADAAVKTHSHFETPDSSKNFRD